MPKAPAKTREKTARKDPIKPKNTKDSHLYTDDNPSTTIHGTGFKDKEAAERTLDLIKERSLIYQWATVNTMYNRAKHHPAMKKAVEGSASTADMRAAMEVFREWLDTTYPAGKDAMRAGGFKPLLTKKTVEKYQERIQKSKKVGDLAKQFAKVYAELAKGKKLGHVLVDDMKPMEADWERKRYQQLDKLVPSGKENSQDDWKLSELWTDDKDVSDQHLELIAWAWSPVPEKKLP
ncbi:uncharacterized protein MYCFIDRAFT_80604 [Pseudocercospora fijiensis CIRAD86]|uniref:Uncharacterized protein n=1 Tax=Pseudocercospora fijiensis (strain CIRAD86) TaxID=383855 RepID=M3B0S1_PSEFD|nr:uncharacterized protein MYCFIDRAFT_80604 [Pseudocercospora fijiensis CIRAD86]EME83037.1 hypothetical protein MYCFIDRAFT_80604 [Pseudocercospora fijiensis CIRAD86]